MDIINHTTKDVCKLKYFPYSYFSKDVPRKVTGVVTDVNGQARWVLTGKIKHSFFPRLYLCFLQVHGQKKSKVDPWNPPQVVMPNRIIWKHVI
jgi:hypothetical protein